MKIKQIIKQLFCWHKYYGLSGGAETGEGGITHGFDLKKKCLICRKNLKLSSDDVLQFSHEARKEILLQELETGVTPKEVTVLTTNAPY